MANHGHINTLAAIDSQQAVNSKDGFDGCAPTNEYDDDQFWETIILNTYWQSNLIGTIYRIRNEKDPRQIVHFQTGK